MPLFFDPPRAAGRLALVACLALSMACARGPAAPSAPSDPKSIVDAFITARNGGDSQAALALVDVEIVGDVLAQDADYADSTRSAKVGVEAVVKDGTIRSLVETDMKVCPMGC